MITSGGSERGLSDEGRAPVTATAGHGLLLAALIPVPPPEQRAEQGRLAADAVRHVAAPRAAEPRPAAGTAAFTAWPALPPASMTSRSAASATRGAWPRTRFMRIVDVAAGATRRTEPARS